jgi:hypothetical protein
VREGEMLWRELIEIPAQIHKSDFVLNLSEGVEGARAQETVRQYVVTPQLVEAYRAALEQVRSSLRDGKSRASYLHGSFGSGKSHFMAILTLLLRDGDNRTGVRGLERLYPLVLEHQEWLGKRRLLSLPLHMVGATNMESGILGGYVAYVKRQHPEAELPGVYPSQKLLEDARRLMGTVGEDRFFQMLNGDAGASGGAWGALSSRRWSRERFEAAGREEARSAEHQALVSALVSKVFTAAGGLGEYVDLDAGLAIIAQHAAGLGYEGLLLFLDELILWLASHAGDMKFVQREGQKIAKLVEGQHGQRAVPLISFVARQRDLRDFVGEGKLGAERSSLSDMLQWWEGRFGKILLEDRNLPLVVQERLLRPRDARAREAIRGSFEAFVRDLDQETQNTLWTSQGDTSRAGQVYPFSLAMMDALVALSSFLQRERTALRLLQQMLINGQETLSLGRVLGLGELWDVIMAGEEPLSEELSKPYRAAKALWEDRLLPLLRREYKLGEGQEASSLTGPQRSNYEGDSLALKTVLIGALVPKVESLRGLTVRRLVSLNHGVLYSPVAGAEVRGLLTRLRRYASEVGELRVGSDPADPEVSAQLHGLDPDDLLRRVDHEDRFDDRRQLVQELLYQEMKLEEGLQRQGGLLQQHVLSWRGQARTLRLQYGNVREMSVEQLRCDESFDWHLVLDYPMDEGSHRVADDRARVNECRGQLGKEGTRTLVWLPHFLSEQGLEKLGRLVRVRYVLRNYEEQSRDLSAQDRPMMRQVLENLEGALRHGLVEALRVAYGLSSSKLLEVEIDSAHHVHLESLWPSWSPQVPAGKHFAQALQEVEEKALEQRYPAAPMLPHEPLSKAQWVKVSSALKAGIMSRDKRYEVEERDVRALLRTYGAGLGLWEMGETHLRPLPVWRDRLERALGRVEEVEVGAVRAHVEPRAQPTGAPRAMQDLIILSFGWWEDMSLVGGEEVPGRLEDKARLVRRPLPSEAEWEGAQAVAKVLGFKSEVWVLRSRDNCDALAQRARLDLAADQVSARAASLRKRLERFCRAMSIPDREWRESARLRALGEFERTLSRLRGADPVEVVRAVSELSEPGARAVYVGTRDALLKVDHLEEVSPDILSRAVSRCRREDVALERLLGEVREVLLSKEGERSLETLKGLEGRILDLLTPEPVPDPEPPVPDPEPPLPPVGAWSVEVAPETLEAALSGVKERVSKGGRWTLTLTREG